MNEIRGNSLKFEADFFRKSNNLTVTREKKIRSIQMRTMHMLVLLAVVLLVGLTVFKVATLLLECQTLQVRSFRLRNQPLFEKERMREILRRCSGNILALNLGRLRAQLLQLPEIKDAAISRILPDTIEVGFTLRQPCYSLYENGVYRLFDAEGVVLGEQQAKPLGLISIRAADGSVPVRIAAFSQELLPLREKIEYVAFAEPYGIELKLLAEPEIFYPGEKNFLAAIDRYLKIKPHLALNGAIVRYVDLRIAGRIYFEALPTARGDT